MTEFKAVLFDLDGTITDSNPFSIQLMSEMAEKLTGYRPLPDEMAHRFGPPDLVVIEKFMGESYSEKVAEYYLSQLRAKVLQNVIPMPGIYEMLCSLKAAKIPTGLYSARSLVAAEVVLEELGLKSFFEYRLGGDSFPGEKYKPDPEGILVALQHYGIAPEEMLYVGDSKSDIKAAKAAGVHFALAMWAPSAKRELGNEAEYMFEHPAELTKWILKKTAKPSEDESAKNAAKFLEFLSAAKPKFI